MANRFAVANGDWSNTATWDGGTLPTSSDDVYANNFNVNVNQNIDVISLRNEPNTGITAGGTFTFNTSGVTADISNNIVMNPTVSTSFILITASSGLVTMNIPNGNVQMTNTANANFINHSGNCNLTITCISLKGHTTQLNINSSLYTKSSTGIFTLNGNVDGRSAGGAVGSGATVNLTSSSTNVINGNITGGNSNNGTNAGSGVVITSGNLTVTGNIIGGLSNNNVTFGIIFTSTGILNITGNLIANSSSALFASGGTINVTGIINGGTVNGRVGLIIEGTGTLNHIGVAQASAFGSAIACNAPTTSVVTCTGPFLRNGFIPAIASQTLRINALSNPYFEFRKSDNTNVTYVDEDTLNFPIELDVREGTSYASGLYTGTLAVPLPSNVRVGIATDDTIGTADLTAEDFWNYLVSNGFASGSMGERMKNVSTVASTGAQIASYSV
jgi:hypothetical protein